MVTKAPTICPPALAKGIKTTAEVKRMRRPRGQGPRKLIRKNPKPKKRRTRTKKWVDITTYDKPKGPPTKRWTTLSRKLLNEKKERMVRRRQRLRNLVNSDATLN